MDITCRLLFVTVFANLLVVVRLYEVEKVPLYIGGLFPSDIHERYGGLISTAIEAIEHVNNCSEILAEYELVLVWRNTKVDIGLGLYYAYEYIYHGPQMIALIGPLSSYESISVNPAIKYYHLVQLNTGLARILGDEQQYPYTVQMYPEVDSVARVALIKHFNWKRVSVLYRADDDYWESLARDTVVGLEQEGVSIISVEAVGENADVNILNLKNHDARILFILGYSDQAVKFLCSAYKHGLYGDKYVWIMPGWYYPNWWKSLAEDLTDCTPEQLDLAVEGHLGIEVYPVTTDLEKLDFTVQSVTHDFKTYFEVLRDRVLVDFSWDPFAYDMVWIIALALHATEDRLNSSGSTKRLKDFTYNDKEIADMIYQETKKVNFYGMTFNVEFDDVALRRRTPHLIQQLQNGKEIETCRYNVNPDSLECFVPFTWDIEGRSPPIDGATEVIVVVSVSPEIRYSIYGLTVFGILLSLFFLFVNLKYRHTKVLKMTSPILTSLIPIGCILVYSSIFVADLDPTLISEELMGHLCKVQYNSTFNLVSSYSVIFMYVQIGLLTIGISLSFGALFMKTYRVHIIFNVAMKSFRTKKGLQDIKLISATILFALFDAIVLTLWMTLDPSYIITVKFDPVLDMTEPEKEIYNVAVLKTCSSKDELYYAVVLVTVKVVLLLFGVFLAWKTRRVEVPGMNESRYIALSIYIVAITCLVSAAVVFFMKQNVVFTYTFLGSAILVSNTSVLCLMFVPKIKLLYLTDNTKSQRSGMSMKLSAFGKFGQNDDDITKLKSQLNKKYEQLSQLRQILREYASCDTHARSLKRELKSDQGHKA
ncbi:gamma-aminobutyric acid type B receptor subunit 2-like [Saccoglossus kowalevskii]